jgi:cation diffusion facilitator CzcD-associated flavoprotein CzcO
MTTHMEIAILGAGFAGLGMAIQLKRRGVRDFVVFERASEVGGTWRDNTYPGCACDIKSDLYSFSFAPNPDWTHKYARQPEILAYLKATTDRFEVRPHLRLGHEMQRAEWDAGVALWRIQTSGGEYTARVLISGHGPLIQPKWPDIPGLNSFQGQKFHSARWDHSVDLTGRRVAVIGTGASAIQFVPEVQQLAGQLTVFQRTAPWIMPRMDHPTSEGRRRLFRRFPLLQRLQRQWLFGVAEARFLSFTHERFRAAAESIGRRHLEAQVSDPTLRAQLTPTYRAGCKRILVSDDYYPALTHPPVASIIFGTGGRSLAQAWRPHMEALHGTTVAGFPNLFLIVGPNTALGHNSIVYIAEAQIAYILHALSYLDASGLAALEPIPQAQAAYNAALQEKLARSVWVQGGCTSYYLDDTGRNSTLWPERASRFRRTLRRFNPALYRGLLSPERPPPLLTHPRAAK